MTDLASLFRNSGDDDDDAITIQATNANSHLGTLLLESDWDECASYLRTPDGRRDVIDGTDPLGILPRRGVVAASNSKDGCAGEGTVLFAALYVRAPYDIVRMIHDILTQTTPSPASDHIRISNYLVYVLYVVPSEEASRLLSNDSSPATTAMLPFYQRTRAWSMDEYEKIIHLLLRSISSSSTLLTTCYQRTARRGGGVGNNAKGERTCSLTPLAIACYNHDVPPSFVSVICALQPRAMDVECTFFTRNADDNEGFFFVKTLSLFLAAASPLPTNKLSSPEHKEMHERRWKKVQLLTLGSNWYNNNINKQSSIDNETSLYATARVEPTSDQVKRACINAIQYEEWELVREYMNRYPAVSTEIVVVPLDNNNNNVSTTTIANALARHDNRHTETLQHRKRKQEKRRKRREWLHRNMGPVMYEIDAIMDVVLAVIPLGKKNKRRGGKTGRGIVLPMGIYSKCLCNIYRETKKDELEFD